MSEHLTDIETIEAIKRRWNSAARGCIQALQVVRESLEPLERTVAWDVLEVNYEACDEEMDKYNALKHSYDPPTEELLIAA